MLQKKLNFATMRIFLISCFYLIFALFFGACRQCYECTYTDPAIKEPQKVSKCARPEEINIWRNVMTASLNASCNLKKN